MDDGTYVIFLVVGTALVLVDGQVIYRSGLKYLNDSYGDDGQSARSMARLVSMLFHLAVLGVLALVSTIDIGGDTALEAVVMRLGVVLVVLAIAHAVTIRVLTRMRDRLDAENLTKQRYDSHGHENPVAPPATPDQGVPVRQAVPARPRPDRPGPSAEAPRGRPTDDTTPEIR